MFLSFLERGVWGEFGVDRDGRDLGGFCRLVGSLDFSVLGRREWGEKSFCIFKLRDLKEEEIGFKFLFWK